MLAADKTAVPADPLRGLVVPFWDGTRIALWRALIPPRTWAAFHLAASFSSSIFISGLGAESANRRHQGHPELVAGNEPAAARGRPEDVQRCKRCAGGDIGMAGAARPGAAGRRTHSERRWPMQKVQRAVTNTVSMAVLTGIGKPQGRACGRATAATSQNAQITRLWNAARRSRGEFENS
jgi:hypothetical protein